MNLYIDANGNLTCIPPRFSKPRPDEKKSEENGKRA